MDAKTEQKTIVSKVEYEQLLLKSLEGYTMTDQEMKKISEYENSILQKSDSAELGRQKSYSTPAGKALSIDEDKNQGFTNALLVISIVAIVGILVAGLILYS